MIVKMETVEKYIEVLETELEEAMEEQVKSGSSSAGARYIHDCLENLKHLREELAHHTDEDEYKSSRKTY